MFDARFWRLSAALSLGAALLLGLPTRLIPNGIWTRTVPTQPFDYVIWILSFLLIGPLAAMMWLYPLPKVVTPTSGGRVRVVMGSLLSYLSVGCPVCNKVVVFLFGLGGAMTFFNPLRPWLGLASVLILGVTVYYRVRTLRFGCPVPRPRTSDVASM
jgi:hypothetical protein